MYILDPVLAALLDGPHQPCARFSFLAPDRSVRASYEASGSVLLGGGVSFDLTGAGRRSGSAELANTTGALSPQAAGDLAFPGALVRVERGAVLPGGGRLYGLLATLAIASFQASMSGRLALTFEDVLEALAQPFGAHVVIEAGTRAGDVLRAAWEPVLGASTGWSIDDAGRTVARRVFLEDEDRLAAVAQLMADLGLEVLSDRTGTVVLRPVSDPTTTPVARTFSRTPGTATMLELQRSGNRLPYNRVIVIAESPDRPTFRAERRVTDPASPIHPDRIGLRTAPIHRSAQIPDQAAANAVAEALLLQYSLYQDSIGSTVVPAIELDEGDVIEVSEPVSGTNDRYRITRITHPIAGGGTRIDTATKVLPVFAP